MTHPLAPLMAEIKERLGLEPSEVHEIHVRHVKERGLVVRVTTGAPITFGDVKATAVAYPEFDLGALDQ